MPGHGAGASEEDTYILELSKNVSANTTYQNPETVTTDMPFAVRVVGITLGWLSGANAQAGVKIKNETGNTYIPYNEQDLDNNASYIASNDFTGRFPVRFGMDDDETLIAEFINVDGSNSHLVNVFVTVERRMEE